MAKGVRELTFAQALNEALRQEMRRDETVFVVGEDVATFAPTAEGSGGIFGVTKGLVQEFGHKRVRNTPISESAFVGAAGFCAACGFRPVVEIMFADFSFVAMDQILNQIPKYHWVSTGKIKLPVVIRIPYGVTGVGYGMQHSQSPYSYYVHTPGLKVVIPSTPYDAKGLLITAIRDDDPVVFFEHKFLYTMKGPVPEEEYTIPFGKADIKGEGNDITVVATGLMVHKALDARKELGKEGISVEVIDPRTLVPLDKEAIFDSVKKTGRLVVVDEDWKRCGVASEIAALVAEEAFSYLKSPIKRLANPNVPVPAGALAPGENLEFYVIPRVETIIKAVKEIVK
jgi:pyruvate dehydrogenase E1 component beta subunit